MTDDQGGFSVQDKRRFNTDGSIKSEAVDSPSNESGQSKESHKSTQETPSFEINFSTFLLSLASSVQIALGAVPHPSTGKPEVNLVAARQTIEILSMLEDKTKNNLAKDEEALFKHILHDLRMSYVAVAKTKEAKSK